MQALVDTFKAWQLHPVVDHFTIALIILGILVDLLGSLMPSRSWPRTTALTLMVVGTAAAWGSKLTGGWEAGRVWENVKGPALEVLKRHAELGDWLPWVFLGLALWRIGIQFLGFMGSSRSIYLLIAVIAGGVIIYQGHLGGELVFEYGVGTELMPTATPSEAPQATPSPAPAEPAAIPTVFNPSEAPTPAAEASPEVSPAASPEAPSAMATPMETPAPVASSTPAAEPTATPAPLPPGATPVNPPSGTASPDASPGAAPAPKNL